ncbi:ABC transporter permease [Cohnella phaseoli]|uniref:ABC-2 type transport system permease protein n=1 Tax=Cohnella phaseoli TaxID=456490 RepID=A0A3D9K9Z5_9BACL|nr:ABC transporter permease [Cohnella phaseoli]RED83344.1 ABC-2 type transport system permease protein [Cohnella phaseoli]
MSSLGNLIRNENMKIYRRPRTWLMIGFLVLAIGLMSGLMKWDDSRSSPDNWQQSLTQQNVQYQKQLAEDKNMDSDYKEFITDKFKINEYYLAHDMNPYALSLWDYVNSSASLILLITILTVIVAADMIAAEFTWGTIKLLLVGPASRSKIMLGKYISTMMFALLLLILAFVVAFAAGAALQGFDGLAHPHLSVGADGLVHENSMIVNALQKYGYAVVSLLMYVTLAFMISSAFRSSSMAIAFSLLFMLVGNTVTMLLSRYEWSKYLLFANTELSQYLPGNSPIRPEMTLGFSITMLAAYYVVFQIVAWTLFTKRDVAA